MAVRTRARQDPDSLSIELTIEENADHLAVDVAMRGRVVCGDQNVAIRTATRIVSGFGFDKQALASACGFWR